MEVHNTYVTRSTFVKRADRTIEQGVRDSKTIALLRYGCTCGRDTALSLCRGNCVSYGGVLICQMYWCTFLSVAFINHYVININICLVNYLFALSMIFIQLSARTVDSFILEQALGIRQTNEYYRHKKYALFQIWTNCQSFIWIINFRVG